MPYNTLLWAEAQAMNGLVGMAALALGNEIAASGDKQVLPAGEDCYISQYGMTSDTKGQACNLLPDISNGNKGYYGPGSTPVFYPLGWLDVTTNPIHLMKNDSITGQGSNTNVNEGAALGAHCFYGRPPAVPTRKTGRIHYHELVTITSAAAVTYNSGAATIYAAATNTTNWYDPEGTYVLNGISGYIGGATFGGFLNVTGLGGRWKGYAPSIPINALDAVIFSTAQPYTPFPEPIGPITGWELANTAKLGMTATSAGAQTFVLHISKL